MIRVAADLTTLFVALLLLGLPAVAQEDLSTQIRTAQSAGNYLLASKLYGQLIQSGTDTPELRSNYGIMLHLAGKNREALDQLRIALNRNPALAAPSLFAGLAAFDLGEPKTALSYLKRARELDAQRPAPLLALGKTYVALREYAAANECYAKAAGLDKGSAEAWYGLGVTNRTRAEELLNRAARLGQARNNPDKAKAEQLLDDAMKALNRAIDLQPDSARTHLLLAQSLADAGKFADAVPEYQTAIHLDPTLDGAYLGLATEYWKQRQFDQALPLLQKILATSPKDPEANGILADILQHNGDNAAAKRHAITALAGNPELIETHVVLARVYLAGAQPKLAVEQLKKVMLADPDGSYHFLLYRAYKQAGDDLNARKTMAEFQQIRYGNGPAR